ncbi:hypothetical protein L1077_21575 [Pseudoalteromonas luteoviolacea]|uniref:phage tail tube protein n=1 Tax=Pseudoalteromonas luteoviolacea TaxID=43657 RepID=UPI001F24B0F3|nr:phage tail tube protein [Pseudoalteromonas luteoviolacea]MCF6442024.1 hypothetical protein [Pseudoalteromonas luteoviolacea]
MPQGIEATFHRKHKAGEVTEFVEVGRVVENSGLAAKRDTKEKKEYGQQSSWRLYEPGKRDPGELTIGIKWHASQENEQAKAMYEEFESAEDDDAINEYEIHYPVAGNKKRSFKAIITAIEEPVPDDEDMVQKFKFKLTGPIVKGVWA